MSENACAEYGGEGVAMMSWPAGREGRRKSSQARAQCTDRRRAKQARLKRAHFIGREELASEMHAARDTHSAPRALARASSGGCHVPAAPCQSCRSCTAARPPRPRRHEPATEASSSPWQTRAHTKPPRSPSPSFLPFHTIKSFLPRDKYYRVS